MKYNGIIFLLIAPLFLFGQHEKDFNLEWKISSDEKIAYETVMNVIDTNTFKFAFNFSPPKESTNNNSDDVQDELQQFQDEMLKAHLNYGYITLLSEDEQNSDFFDLKMIGYRKADAKETDDILSNIRNGVQLRGKINKKGNLESWYLKKAQKNLVSILMELPTHTVKVGDTWSIEVNLLSMDQSFEPDTFSRKNEVTLVDVEIINGEEIAILKYDIESYVSGNMYSPFLDSNEGLPTYLYMTHKGIAKFNITKGRWADYNCLMHIDLNGPVKQVATTLFKLTPISVIPVEILDYK